MDFRVFQVFFWSIVDKVVDPVTSFYHDFINMSATTTDHLKQTAFGCFVGLLCAIGAHFSSEWKYQGKSSEIIRRDSDDEDAVPPRNGFDKNHADYTCLFWSTFSLFVAYFTLTIERMEDKTLATKTFWELSMVFLESVGPSAYLQLLFLLIVVITMACSFQRETLKRYVRIFILCPVFSPLLPTVGLFAILKFRGDINPLRSMLSTLCSLVIVMNEHRMQVSLNSVISHVAAFLIAMVLQSIIIISGKGHEFYQFTPCFVAMVTMIGFTHSPPTIKLFQLQHQFLGFSWKGNNQIMYYGRILHLNQFGYAWIEYRRRARNSPRVIQMVSSSDFQKVTVVKGGIYDPPKCICGLPLPEMCPCNELYPW